MNFAKLLEEALEERGNAIMVIARPADGEDAVIQTSNDSFARMMGGQAEGLAGSRLGMLRPVAQAPVDWSSFITAVTTLTPLQQDMKLRVGDRESWFGFGLTFKTDAADGSAYGIVIGRDITQARRRTLQDNESQRLLASVFLRTSAPVMIVRFNGAILMANPASQRLLGYGAEEMLGLNVQTLTRGESAEVAAAARAKQRRDGIPYEIRIETITKAQTPVPVRLTSVLLGEVDEQSLRVVTLLPDFKLRDPPPERAEPASLSLSDIVPRSIGQVQVISLMAFKMAFSEVWQHSAARAMMQAEHIIKRRIGGDDVFSRIDDHGFIVWFDSSDGERNASILTAAAREIRSKFLAEFGDDVASHVSAVVVGEGGEPNGLSPSDSTGRLLPTQALLARLRDQRHAAWLRAKAMLQDLREAGAEEAQTVTGRDRKVKPMVMVDFTPEIRARIAALPVSGSDGAVEREVDLLRLDHAIRQLGVRRTGNIVVPISWSSLTAADRRRLVDERFARIEPPARSRLILAISGVPPFPTPKRWSEIVTPLRRQFGEIGLLVSLAEGDLVPVQEAIVNEWPLSLLVIDGTAAAAMAPDAYYEITVAARYREIPVLVRMADPKHLRDWHELGATMFTGAP